MYDTYHAGGDQDTEAQNTAKRTHRHKFSTVNFIATEHSKQTRALTLENFSQFGASLLINFHSFSLSLPLSPSFSLSLSLSPLSFRETHVHKHRLSCRARGQHGSSGKVCFHCLHACGWGRESLFQVLSS